MNKQTKLILAGVLVATGAYLYFRSKKSSKSFANVVGKGYYFGSTYIPAGAGAPFQNNGQWYYCPSGDVPCTVDLVRIDLNQNTIDSID
jgi:hypothetical protein